MYYNLLAIRFSNSPLWLLLLIPAVASGLIPYFLLNKKYRRTRNRIASIVLHLFVCLFAILTLAGLEFVSVTPNEANEIILLVDVSDTEDPVKSQRDDFIKNILNESRFDGYKVGIVTFGFTQNYAVPLTYNIKEIYETYAEVCSSGNGGIDASGTDIAAALSFTKDLFEHPKSGKIVLITDGKQTDEDVLDGNVVSTVSAMGIRIDSVYVPSEYTGADVQITDIIYPDYHVGINQDCLVTVTLQAKEAVQDLEVEISYNDGISEQTDSQIVELSAGESKNVFFVCNFKKEGIHTVKTGVSVVDDLLKENNEYHSYFFLEVFNKVLIFERYEGSSVKLKEMLEEEETFVVETVNLLTSEKIPQTAEELRAYDQIIMNNIANDDIPLGLEELLYSYVYDYGGGLFTVGGDDEKGDSHAYSHTQKQNTVYRKMLPVEAIKYTPPVGVYILIDASGSMNASSETGLTAFELAKAGAKSCLEALSERDYIGVMALSNTYENALDLTRCTETEKIITSIDKLEMGGSTNFYASIERAGLGLSKLDVSQRHIMIISDGGNNGRGDYISLARNLYVQYGITVSVLGVNMNDSAKEAMEKLVEAGNGPDTKGRLYEITDGDRIVREMRESLKADVINEKNDKPFNPIILNPLSSVVSGLIDTNFDGANSEGEETTRRNVLSVKLNGIYGTRARDGAEVILAGEYNIPLYAQWKYGKGMVGSFMCDLNGVLSEDFMADEKGKLFVYNVVNNLMPMESIRVNDISVRLEGDNYLNKMSVVTELGEGEYVTGKIVELTGTKGEVSLNSVSSEEETASCYVTSALASSNNYSRCNFVLKSGGVYQILLEKYDADGQLISSYSFYKSFAYSQEYNSFLTQSENDCRIFLTKLSKDGGGSFIEKNSDLVKVFEGFVTELEEIIDPKPLMIILSIILFLLDVFVRKFKFKWLHEIIRDQKEKRKNTESNSRK